MATTGIVRDKYSDTTRQAAIKARTMQPTAAKLIRWAGLSAIVAGLFYVVVGLFHPVETLASVTTTRWLIVHALATAMCFFGPLGLVGLYARQVKEAGWLGLAGYLLLTLFYALTAPFTFAEVFLLPPSASAAPMFVESYLGMFNGHPGAMNLGILATVYTLSGVVYILGGLLFGIATIRAGVLPRWAAALLALGTGLSPAAAVLPEAHKALVAVPMGLALAWLGYSLWSERREHAAEALPDTGGPGSARSAPSRRAGTYLEGTGGRMAACRAGYASVTRSSPTAGDGAAPAGPVAAEGAVQRTQRRV